jgi:hypothetical protein
MLHGAPLEPGRVLKAAFVSKPLMMRLFCFSLIKKEKGDITFRTMLEKAACLNSKRVPKKEESWARRSL